MAERTDAEVMAPRGGGFFERVMGLGARRQARQQALVSKMLNEEIEAGVGDSTSVDLQKVLPQAYFGAARRVAALGNTDEAQKLYAAGINALQSTATHAANLNQLRASSENLDEAPTEYLETMRQRDQLAASVAKFPEGTPTGDALRSRVKQLDERLEILNTRGGASSAALPREIVLAQQMSADRAAQGKTPVTTEQVWLRERMTSQRAQDYALGGEGKDYTDFTPTFQGDLAASTTLGETGIKRLDAEEQDAIAAVTAIKSIDESMKLINEGVRTGTASGARQYVARAAATFLGDDPSTVTVNTDAYIASSAPRLVQIVRALAPVTEQDKDYINAAIAGQLNIGTPEAFRKMLEIAYRAARPKVDRYNERLNRLGSTYQDVAGVFDPITNVPEIDFASPSMPKPVSQMTDEEIEAELNGNSR